jgi:hypothetical protein
MRDLHIDEITALGSAVLMLAINTIGCVIAIDRQNFHTQQLVEKADTARLEAGAVRRYVETQRYIAEVRASICGRNGEDCQDHPLWNGDELPIRQGARLREHPDPQHHAKHTED